MAQLLSELLARKAELEQQIIEVQKTERASAIAQIRDLMSQHGLTLADLSARPAPSPAGKPRASTAGAKVPAKYRDPATGQTWSGRGLHPKWLRAAMDAGASLADFAV